MYKLFKVCVLFYLFTTIVKADNYDEAWKALAKNDSKQAKLLLASAMKDPKRAMDAYITNLLLEVLEGKEDKIFDFKDKVFEFSNNPYPYIYALWYNNAVLSDDGKKNPHNLALLEKLITDKATDPMLKLAAIYQKGNHYFMSNKVKEAYDLWSKMGAIEKWQLLGPFDNYSKTNFDDFVAPLAKPKPDAVFKGWEGNTLKWFVPEQSTNFGYISTYYNIAKSKAIVFTQSFVESDKDQKLKLRVGCSGKIRVWINDKMLLSEHLERTTELDYYVTDCQLNKGMNRVLIQLGYTDEISYPNFIVRFTDDLGNAIANLKQYNSFQDYKVEAEKTSTNLKPIVQPFETYFEDRIKADSSNILNYLLLSRAYSRCSRFNEAQRVMAKAMAKLPISTIVIKEYTKVLSKLKNYTKTTEYIEILKREDSTSMLARYYRIDEHFENKKYDLVLNEMDAYEKELFADEYFYNKKIEAYSNLQDYEKVIQLVIEAHDKFPQNAYFITLYSSYLKNVKKDAKGATDIYEAYLKETFNYNIISALIKEYTEQGKTDKVEKWLKKNYDLFKYDPSQAVNLCSHYFARQDYPSALLYADKSLSLSPYNSLYWNNLGFINEQLKEKTKAIDAFKTANTLNHNAFDSRKRLRKLQDKVTLEESFPKSDVYQDLKNYGDKYLDLPFWYVLNEKKITFYEEGSYEENNILSVKVNNTDGVNYWKEVNVPYNENTQDLVIEKAEVVKKNGNKIQAEKSDNALVFTNLEIGDAIFIQYNLQTNTYGELSKEFYDKFGFSTFEPTMNFSYHLLFPKSRQLNYKVTNGDVKFEKKSIDSEFDLYSWTHSQPEEIKSENYMPTLDDIKTTLHVSTISNWGAITKWYSNLSKLDDEVNFELTNAYQEIFANRKPKNEYEKAKLIYDYIEKNVRYSSVSFRQSAFRPQKPDKTLSTKLGDCKDVSNLFVALAKMANIKANMVLVNTRNNGVKNNVLPSIDFNHCIAKANLDNKTYFIELTDNNLPFTALPLDDMHAVYLQIPDNYDPKAKDSIAYLPMQIPSQLIKRIKVDINNADVDIDVKVKYIGNFSAQSRANYLDLNEEKRKEDFQEMISSDFKNTAKLDQLEFFGLNGLTDTVACNYNFHVEQEIIDAGTMKMLKVPFKDVIVSLNKFSKEDRKYPIEYWKYEDANAYSTTVQLKAPSGFQFTDLPVNQKLNFEGIKYDLTYKLINPSELEITRNATINQDAISVAAYPNFRAFVKKVAELESKYLMMKPSTAKSK